MKKIILIMPLIFATFLMLQAQITVSGIVTSSTTSMPVSNHLVNISISDSSFSYQSTAITNVSGQYSFTVTGYPTGAQIQLSTLNCLNQLVYSYLVSPPFTSNFSICTNAIPCNASFYFVADSLNPATIHFINTSSGNPTSFLWNFGDGTSSTLQNPTHTYSASSLFMVSLTIGGNNCQSTIYDTIQIVNSGNCDAVFTKSIDSINTATIHFLDQSIGNPTSWLWNFGDGSSSSLKNPNHTYAQTGNYSVSLYIITPNCYDSVFQSISIVSNMGSLVLYAFADSTLLNVGTAFLYSYNSLNQTIAFKDSVSASLYQGVYLFNFSTIPVGTYKVQIKIPSQSPLASIYYNTWLGNSFNWQNSSVLNIQSGSNFQLISMVKNTVFLPPGNGIISGNISNFNVGGNTPKSLADVFLLKNDSSIIEKTQSDSLGNFAFKNIPYGNYIIYPELLGIKTIPFYLSLNASNPNKEGVNLIINGNSVSAGIEEEIAEKIIFDFYPNPTADFIFIHLEKSFSSNCTLSLLDGSGRLLYSEDIGITAAKDYKIDVSTFTKGVYFLIFTVEKSSVTKKIIKI